MKPDEANVTGLFAQQVVQFCIPHYQRPQAWNVEEHWEPLWDDIEVKANDWFREVEPKQHYLGAVVLAKRQKTGVRGIDRYIVIDGQQRLSTLQYLLKALSLITDERNYEDGSLSLLQELFNTNETMMDNAAVQKHKLWPTFRDRDAHIKVMRSSTADALRLDFKECFTQAGELYVGVPHPRPLHATWFFYRKISKWIEDLANGKDIHALEAMRKAITQSLQLIILWIEAQDDPQVIFECLNGRGAPLRPTDLIKNFVFMAAEAEITVGSKELTEESPLFKNWSKLDEPIWLQDLTRGRIKKPRLEWLIHYCLQAETGDDLDSSRTYQAYQKWAASSGTARISADDQVATILSHADNLERFISEKQEFPIGAFGKIAQAFDVTTVSPVALAIAKNCNVSSQTVMYNAIASYLVRRETCGLTKKSYNNIFLALLKELKKQGFTLEALTKYLGSLEGEASLWPDDERFSRAISTRSLYGSGSALNVCRLLLATAATAIGASHASEAQWSPDWRNLHVEHLMPQSWYEFWALPDGTNASLEDARTALNLPDDETDQGKRRKLIRQRENAINTLGNLTILNKEINMQIKNHCWEEKRVEIGGATQLRMNFDLISEPSWDERKIQKRGQDLQSLLISIWPGKSSLSAPTI